MILDCLTLWVSNLMGIGAQDDSILASADRLAAALTRASFPSIVVTDEVGAGIVPDNPTARRFRDLLGWTNQKIAAVANDVILMVLGLSDARQVTVGHDAMVSSASTSTISPQAPIKSPVIPPSHSR